MISPFTLHICFLFQSLSNPSIRSRKAYFLLFNFFFPSLAFLMVFLYSRTHLCIVLKNTFTYFVTTFHYASRVVLL